jgi:hypothetical protein
VPSKAGQDAQLPLWLKELVRKMLYVIYGILLRPPCNLYAVCRAKLAREIPEMKLQCQRDYMKNRLREGPPRM